MNRKEILTIILLICVIFSLQAVSAADSGSNSTDSDVLSVDSVSSYALPNSESNGLVGNANEGSFTDLQGIVNGGSEVNLTMNYTYNDATDSALKTGIKITGTRTINGNGNVIIDANHMSRIFFIAPGATVTLKGITFVNANATVMPDGTTPAGHGGSIFTKGVVHIDNCIFRDNTATNANGGAVFINGFGSTITNSKFENNIAIKNPNNMQTGVGGSVFLNASNITIKHSEFVKNWAGMNGGGVGSSGNRIQNCTITNCTFASNTANGSAGGVGMQSSNFRISDSTFKNNEAKGMFTMYPGNGGAMVMRGWDSYAYNCTFINNTAAQHGGAAFSTNTTYDPLNNNTGYQLCKFINNTAGSNGGAVDWAAGATYGYIKDSTFTNNTAKRSGGAVHWSGHYGLISNSTFTNNNATGEVTSTVAGILGGGDGGAVFWAGINGTVDNCRFINNSAVKNANYDVGGRGGAVFIDNCTHGNKNTTFRNSYFENNTAGTNGGAIDWHAGAHDGHVENVTFVNNIANRSGGAIFWSGIGGTIKESNFTNNKALGIVEANDTYGNMTYGGYGGAVMWTGSNGTVDNCRFISNEAKYNAAVNQGGRGGAVYLQGSANDNCTNTTFSNCYFESNFAGTNGGAIDWHEGAHDGHVINSTFENNTANSNGGAVYWRGHEGYIINSNFTNNTARGMHPGSYGNVGDGGAVFWAGINGYVENCRFIDNEAIKNANYDVGGRGGAVFIDNCTHGNKNTTFKKVYFENNIAGTNGGAVDWHSGAQDGLVENATFINNTARRSGGAIFWNGHNGTIRDANFTNNRALGVANATSVLGDVTYGGDGGAVMWSGALGTVDNVRFINNTAAKRGGAVFLQSAEHEPCDNTTFRNSHFENNTAGTNGGAIDWNKGAHKGIVENVTFVNNTARRSGGAIFWNGENGTVKNSKFKNNRATGEVLQYNMALTMDDVIVVNADALPANLQQGKLYVLNYTSGSLRVFKSYVVDENNTPIKLDETTTISGTISPKDWAIDQFFGGDGGTLLWGGNVGIIDNCTFEDSNSARRGGAAYMTGSSNVTFSNCNFTKSTSGTNGGGVDWLAGARYGKIINCTFNETRAARSAGAIYYDGWYGEMINITIINAKAWGGSLDNSSDGKVKYAGWDSSHWDTNTTGGDAGALMITGSHEYLYNITFINCTATGRGGAVFLQDNHNVTFDLCTFENNRALGIANNTFLDPRNASSQLNVWRTGHGGAIGFDIGASDGTIKNSKFINNTAARDGGAISFSYGSSNATIYNSSFINNTAKRNGGAFEWNGDNGNISYCNFTNNAALGEALDTDHVNLTSLSQVVALDRLPQATTDTTNRLFVLITKEKGKNVKYELYVTVPTGLNKFIWIKHAESNDTDASPTDWAIDQYYGGDGGSIVWGGNVGVIDNCRFIDSNSARRGGGAYMLGSDNVTVSNSYFENTTSGTNGGGLDWLAGANYGKVINCTFNNTRAARSAGAIYYDGDYGEMTNITVINATAFGGALDNSSDGKVKYYGWDSSHWDTNTTGGDGGAMMFTGDYVNVYNVTFYNCTAAGRGGAVFLQANHDVTFEACTFEENSALGIANNTWKNYLEERNDANKDTKVDLTLTGHGGAIAFDVGASEGTILNCTFNANHAARDGGAAYYAAGASKGYIINSTFTNHTINYDGGAIYLNGTYCEIHNSTFINNSAKDDGGAIFWQGEHGIIYNITCDYNHGTGTGINDTSSTKGGVICLTGSDMVLSKSTFTNSFGGLLGGTLFVTGNDVNITDSLFINSTIGMEDGGAIYVLGNNTLIRNCTFENCTAPNNGGVIYILGNNAIVDNSTITNSLAVGIPPTYHSIEVYCGETINKTLKQVDAMIEYLNNTLKGGNITSADMDELNNTLHKLKTDIGNILTGEGLVNSANMTKALITLNQVNTTLKNINATLSLEESKTLNVLFDNVKNIKKELGKSTNATKALDVYGTITHKIDDMISSLDTLKAQGISDADITALNNTLQSMKNAAGSIFNNNVLNLTNVDLVSILLTDLNKTVNDINATLPSTQSTLLNDLSDDISDIESELDYLYDNADNLEIKAVGGLGGAIYVSGNGSIVNGSKISYTTAYKGGGIYVAGNNVLVNNTEFTNINATEDGGAIYVSGQYGKLYNSKFINNTVGDDGGAIYWDGHYGIVYNITCINNNGTGTGIPRGTSSTKGGTMIITGDHEVVSKSTFENSYAGLLGGTIFITGNDVNVTDSSFKHSTVGLEDGGTLYILGNETNILNCTIEDSAARYGGAIFIEGHNATISVKFKDTNATLSGGSIYIEGMNATILNSTFDKTYAFGSGTNGGGAIFIYGNFSTVEGSKFNNNHADNDDARGGAIYINGLNATINGSDFKNSKSKLYGGAIYIDGKYTSVIGSNFTDCTVVTNVNGLDTKGGAIYVSGDNAKIDTSNFKRSTETASSRSDGGFVYIDGKNATLSSSTFIQGITEKGHGGAIYINKENAVVYNCTVNNSKSKSGMSGAIHLAGFNAIVNGSSFNNNIASKEGGAIYVAGGGAKVLYSNFTSNKGLTGGAIRWMGGHDDDQIIGCIFKYNNATNMGGAVSWDRIDQNANGNAYIKDCEFISNKVVTSATSKHGGALHFLICKEVTIDNCIFIGNQLQTGSGDGGAIYAGADNMGALNFTVINSKFINNTAKSGGGAIASQFRKNNTIINSTFIGNEASFGGDIVMKNGNTKMAIIDGCNFTNSKGLRSNNYGDGGGSLFINVLNATVANSRFVNCSSVIRGGAISWGGKEGKVYGSTFINCSSPHGGAVYAGVTKGSVGTGENFNLTNSKFINCNSSNEGGAIYLNSAVSTKEVSDLIIIGCYAPNGGGIAVSGKNVPIKDILIANSSATNGGGIYWDYEGGTIKNVTIINNTATLGGGFYTEKFTGAIEKSNFTLNKAHAGSAIYTTKQLTLRDTSLLKNRADTASFNATLDLSGSSIEIDFAGWDNYLNAMFVTDSSKTITCNNVTYLNESGVVNTGSRSFTNHPAEPTLESGQNFTVIVGDSLGRKLNTVDTFTTDKDGHISITAADLGLPSGSSIKFADVYLTNQHYYTYVENTTRIYPNITGSTTNATFHLNGTVSANLTDGALGNVSVYIDGQWMGNITLEQAKGTINVSTLVHGKYLEVGNYTVVLKYAGDGKYRPIETTAILNVTKAESRILFNVTPHYYDFIINVTVEHYDTGIVTNPNDVTGNVTLNVRGQIINVELVNGSGIGIAYNMPPGAVNISATYSGDSNYKPSSNRTSANITERSRTLVVIEVSAEDIYVNETIQINVTVVSNQTVNGNITVILDNVEYNLTLVNSTASRIFGNLTAGHKIVTAIFAGDDTLAPSIGYTHFNVNKYDAYILIDAKNITYGDEEVITLTVPSDVKQGTINVTINGTTFKYKHILEVINGTVEIDLSNLNVDTYNITAMFESPKYKFTVNSSLFKVSPLKPPIVIQPTNVTYGNNTVIFVEVVGAVGGNITLKINDTLKVFENVTLINDTATFTVQLPAGNYTIDVYYSGDELDLANSAKSKFTVFKANPTIDITTTDIRYGFDEEIHVNLNAAGNVTVKVDGNVVLDNVKLDANNHTNFTVTNPKTGTHKVEVIYYGNDNFNPGSKTGEFTVSTMDTKLAIEVDDTILVWDTADIKVIVTDTVGYGYLIPTAPGNVTLYINGVYYTEKVVNSIANFHIDDLPVGDKVVWAFYDGDGDLNPSRAMAKFKVIQRTPVVNVVADNISTAETGKITVNVPANATGYVIVTGNFTNYPIRIDNFNQGIGEIAIANLTAGTYSVHVKYYGEANDNYTIAENDCTFKVSAVNVTHLQVSVDNIVYGDKANITVTIQPGATGTITLKLNDTAGSQITLPIINNKVEWIVENLAAGNYTVNVTYNGDAIYNVNNTSRAFNVTKATPVMTIDTPVSVDAATNATIVVRINETATGNITITVNGTKYNATIEKGVATFIIDKLLSGSYNITAEYIGDRNYTSAGPLTCADNLTVTKVDCYQINVTANDTKVDLNTTIVVKVPVDAVGNVSIYIDGAFAHNATVNQGVAEWNVTMPYGNHTVNVTFTDGKYCFRYATTDYWVFKHDAPLDIDVASIYVGDTAYINVTAPTDNVTIEINGKSYNKVKYENGIAYFEVSGLEYGNKTVVAIYGGSDKYLRNTTTENFTVNKRNTGINITVENITYGGKVNITVNVTDDAKGFITIRINETMNVTLPIENGKVTWIVEGLGVENYTVYAIYSGDEKYNINSTNKTFKVTKAISAITIEESTTDAATNATIVVRISETATGNITITVNGIKYNATIENGMATFTINKLPAGKYDITVEYIGDDNNTPVTSTTLVDGLTVTKVDCYQINVTANDTKVDLNTTIVVKVPVDAVGNVSIYIDGKFKYNATISQGVAEWNVTMPYGNHTVNVTFTDGKYGFRYATTDYWVFKHDAPLDIDVDSIYVGDTAYINVTAPTGDVTIEINGKSYDKVKYENGIAYFEVSDLAYGDKTVVAIYAGDSKYVANSTTENFTVSKRDSVLDVTAVGNSVGNNATITVNVTDGATGYVTINVNGTNYTINLTGSRGSVQIAGLGAGTYYVHATYIGDDKYKSSINNTETFTMTKSDVIMNITVESIDYGQKANITVNITSDATGFITIRINNTQNITLPIDNGRVSWIVDGLAADNYTVYANYSGDGKYNLNNTNKVNKSFEVRQIQPDVDIIKVIAEAGKNATIIVKVDPRTTENITVNVGRDYSIKPNAEGIAVVVTDVLESGSYTVTVSYPGDKNFTSGGAQVDVVTNKTSDYLINITAGDIKVEEDTNIVVNVPVDAEGIVIVNINGTNYTARISQGKAVFNNDTTGLSAGRYNITAYFGNAKYENKTATGVFYINKHAAPITIAVDSILVAGTAYINVTAPSDNVTIEINGKSYNKVKYENGVAYFEVNDLAYANKTVVAIYGGNYKYVANSTTENFTVNKRNSFVEVNVSDIDVGDVEIINVTVPDNAIGYVIVNVNGTNYTVNLTCGVGSLPIDKLTNGTYHVIATYIGDEQYLSSANDTQRFTVSKVSSQINITVSHEGIIPNGTDVNITIKAPVDATGKVNITVFDGLKNESYIIYVNDGVGMLHLETPAIAIYNVTAKYLGDGKYLGSENGTDFEVYPTGKSLAVDTEPVTVAQNETIAIWVSGNHTGDNVTIVVKDSQGNVVVRENATFTTFYNSQLNRTIARITLDQLPADDYEVEAIYVERNGTKVIEHTGSGSFTVSKMSSTLTIKEIRNVTVGDNVTIELELKPDAATGNISVFVNGVEHKTNTSNLTLTIPNLSVGEYIVHAVYFGDHNYYESNASSIFNVSKRITPMDISVTNSKVGEIEQINVTLPNNATGRVLLNIGDDHYYANITNGTAIFNITRLAAGRYNVTAVYEGDDKYFTNKTNSSLVISKFQPEFCVNGTNITVGAGEFISFETQDNITGVVKVEINDKNYTAFVSQGKGNLTVYGLEAGEYNVTVYFGGNDKFLPAVSAMNNFTVRQAIAEIIIVPQNITYGESETIIIYINAEGTVNVTVDKYSVTDKPIIDGKVTIDVPGFMTAGNYTVYVDYSGNANYTNSSAEMNFTVAKADPVMTVEVQNITYGEVEYIIVNVKASGNVTIKVNGTERTIVLKEGEGGKDILRGIAAAINDFKGKATLEVHNLNAGAYPVEVTYNGNENYNKATIKTIFFVAKDNVTVDVQVEDIRVDGKEVINVTLSNVNATGEIIINVDGKNYTRTIHDGKANLTLDKLTNATHSVVVIYEGDDNFNGNWTSDTFNVSKVKPAMSVDVSNRTVGQTERIIVSLPDNATGYVVIDVDGTKYHVDIVKGQEIALEIDNLENKTYNVDVTYSGDGYYEGATSSDSFNVSKVKSDIIVKVENITLGDVAIVNITVTPGATGNVTVVIGDEFNKTIGITDGVISIDVSGLTVGDKTVNVTYNGDEKYLPNTNSTTFSVAKLNSTSNIEIVDNGNGTVTVIVPQNATGNVTIYVDGKNFTGNVSDGIAVITLENVTPGKHNITAVYSGDGNYTNATLNGTVTIPKLESPISVDVSSIKVGDVAYINVTAPSGDVTIEINGESYAPVSYDNGIARFVVENLTYGNKTVAVIYSGNSNYTENFTTANFTVDKRSSFVNVNVSDISVGDVAYVNVTVPYNATGIVVVNVNGTNYTVNVTNGVGSLPISKLGNGTYHVVATYLGDGQYFSNVNGTQTFTVSKVPSQINVTVSDNGIIANGSDVNITVRAPVDATGKVNITISDGLKNTSYIIYVNDGVGILHLETPQIGLYNVSAKYLGDDKYIGSENETEFEVYMTGKGLAVDTEPVTVADQENILVFVSGNHVGDNVTITVKDSNGNIVFRDNATFSSYYGDPFNATSARLKLDLLPAGKYTVEANYLEQNGTKVIEHKGSSVFEVSKLPSSLTIKEIRNISVGENVTIELEFGPDAATGNISVFVNGVEHIVNKSNLTITIPNLGAGEYYVHAFYYGDNNYYESNDTAVFKVSKAIPQITVNATSIDVGDNVLIEITAPGDIAGPVLVDVDGIGYYVNITGGKGQLYVPNLASGDYNVTVRYLGDDKYAQANNTTSFKVSKVASSVNVTVENITVGDKAIINVETPKDLSGNVTVSIDGTDYTVFVSGGKGTLVVPDLGVGPYTVNVTFDGSKKYEPSNNTATFNVNKINLDENDIKVIDQGNGTVVVVVGDNATGNVTVKVGDKEFNATVVNGTAVVQLDGNVTPGTHEVEVIYSGDGTHEAVNTTANITAPKYDAPIDVVIGEAKEGEPVVITVNVPANATGNVTVSVGGKDYPGTVKDGKVIITVDNLTAGDHTVAVVYSGDDNYTGNYSVGNLTVAKAKVVPDMKVVDYGNGTVVVVVGDNATGNVTIKVGDKEFNATVVNGTAVVQLDGNVTPGTHKVDVIYSGDDTHEAANTTTEITAPKYPGEIKVDVSEVTEGEPVVVTVEVPENATGNVTVYVDGKAYPGEIKDGVAVVTIDNLTAGDKTFVVEYSGDGNYTANYTVGNFTVKEAKVVPDMKVVDYGNGTVVVVVGDNATGNVTVKVGNDTYTAEVINGTATVTMDNLTPGKNSVEVIYSGDNTHAASNVNTTVTGPKYVSPIEIITVPGGVGEDTIITVEAPENATGNVTIEVDGVKYTTELVNGTATFTINNLTDGTKTIAVEYSGDDNYMGAHTTANVTISKVKSYVSATVTDINVGENVTIIVTVPGDATGQVLIDIDGVGYYVNVTNGTGSTQIPRMPNGIYPVNLTYTGDDKYLPSSNNTVFNVNKVPSYVIPTARNITVGENEVIIFEVPADATGNLTVVINGKSFTFDSDGVLGVPVGDEAKFSVAVDSGKGILVISGLSRGEYDVSVTYNGNYKYLPSSNSTKFRVTASDCKMDVTDLGNGTVKVVVSDNATGNITIKVGNNTYEAEIVDGVATIDLANETPGKHDIEVIYSGDNSHKGQTVDSSVVIPKKTTPISVSVQDIYVGDTEYVVVTVPENATGTVTIEINAVSYNATIKDGKAVFNVTGLTFGNKTVAVTYGGDDNYVGNFTTGQFEVEKRSSFVNPSSKNIKVGKDEVITVNVPSDATGHVIVTVDGVDYSGEIINGRAKVIIPNLPAGNYKATVTYEGDDKYLPSSNSVSFKVIKNPAPISATGDYIEVGDDATVIVNLPSDATGEVTITVGGKKYTSEVIDGKAIFSIPGLNAGTYTVSVYYSGDGNYEANETTATIVVEDNGHGNGTVEGGVPLANYPTGNPILLLLLIILAVGTTQIRRFRK
ncbi:MAG: Ig-like domain repeat protein [Methanobrevibacter sp.]|nr:Ig-like domain repeat protein [Methanobrevibacter sp.]